MKQSKATWMIEEDALNNYMFKELGRSNTKLQITDDQLQQLNTILQNGLEIFYSREYYKFTSEIFEIEGIHFMIIGNFLESSDSKKVFQIETLIAYTKGENLYEKWHEYDVTFELCFCVNRGSLVVGGEGDDCYDEYVLWSTPMIVIGRGADIMQSIGYGEHIVIAKRIGRSCIKNREVTAEEYYDAIKKLEDLYEKPVKTSYSNRFKIDGIYYEVRDSYIIVLSEDEGAIRFLITKPDDLYRLDENDEEIILRISGMKKL